MASLPTRGLVRALRRTVCAGNSSAINGAAVGFRYGHRSLWWRSGGASGSDGGQGEDGKSNGAKEAETQSTSGDRATGTAAAVEARGRKSAERVAAAAAEGRASSNDAGRSSGSLAEEGPSAEEGAIVPVAGGRTLRRDTGPPFEPRVIGMPLPRRPLFPGQQQLLLVTNPEVIRDLSKLIDRSTPTFVGAFLRRGDHGPVSPGSGAEASSHGDAGGYHDAELYDGDPFELLHHVGTRARIVQAAPFAHPGKNGLVEGLQMLLHGHDLIRLDKVLEVGPPLQLQVSRIKYGASDDDLTVKAFINETMHTIREIMKINPQFREHAAMMHQALERLERGDPHATAHFAASLTTAQGNELMEVLEAESPAEKLRLALELLKKELELSQLQQKIATQIEEKVSKHQREYMLREQLKSIKKELGEDKDDGTAALLSKFRDRLADKTLPKDAEEAIESEMEKFSGLAKESQEYQTTRNYLDWLSLLPWSAASNDTLNLLKAREILDRDHYGLSDVKERIQEFIAVGSLRGAVQGKILCLVGPPGVGKTSIGRSIAEALGRSFYRFSVGGLYDVAEIKGHRRTYVGAMPGKMIQCLKKTQTSNPLVLVDEVDKIGRGHQGDPASALLELLDPSQNSSFLDHYLDVPVDCSKVLFVCTANVTDTIPGPLLDRMEVIRLSGYDLQEKLKIANDYLVPNAMREVGLWPQISEGQDGTADEKKDGVTEEADAAAGSAPAKVEVASLEPASIENDAMEALIRWYCREAGVRNLQKHIEKICRKLATRLVEYREHKAAASDDAEKNSKKPELRVTEDKLSDLVGKPPFTSDRLYEGPTPPGTVTGLAWTALGGSVLYIEATAIPRQIGRDAEATEDQQRLSPRAGLVPPVLSVTGQLGSVMKESSQIGLLVARRQLHELAPSADALFFERNELHLHCPEGATPKDGPSAGVTMVTALMSLAMNKPVRTDLAMTGEVSLNGKVLAVGGIKEKTIAARRAGCRALVFPQANRRDFDELPEYLRDGLEVTFASDYRDVFAVAFGEGSEAA
eukprot:TRINITY_DN47064_c0_g1_i1.p1 TRINITY_DN47064_c0_g1~~TRINITY_DN47064_c0_g1_i1.p1  ORF type:complete len:1068 (+),score=257.84 TRINITY_DN47064_c0_g1_i1:104-3205(+)